MTVLRSTALKDKSGVYSKIGTMGELWATDIKNDILAQFGYGLSDFDLNLDGKVELNGGTVSVTDGNLLTVSASTAVDGQASVETKHEVRYRPGHSVIVQFTASYINATNANSFVWCGPYNGQNGFAIGYLNGVLNIKYEKDGSETFVPVSNFNGDALIDASGTAIDFTNLNVFRITYAYLGISPVKFEVMQPETDVWITVHTIRLHGKQKGTHIDIPYLPIKAEAVNTGNATDITIKSGSWQAGVFGLCQVCGTRFFAFSGEPTIVDADDTLFSFKAVDTFNGKRNHIAAQAINIGAITDTSDTVKVTFWKNATLTGTPSWNNVDTVNSIVQYDTVGKYASGGTEVLSFYLSGAGTGTNVRGFSENISLGDIGLNVFAGDVITIHAKKVHTADVNDFDMGFSVNWQELF